MPSSYTSSPSLLATVLVAAVAGLSFEPSNPVHLCGGSEEGSEKCSHLTLVCST